MAKVLVTESYLSAIASAIRSKAGTQQTFTPAQMASAIADISTGPSEPYVTYTMSGNSVVSASAYNFVGCIPTGTFADQQAKYLSIENVSAISMVSSFAFRGARFYSIDLPSLAYVGAQGTTTRADEAFRGCVNLSSINFPLLSMINGDYVFADCTSLSSVNLPLMTFQYTAAGNTSDYLFQNCPYLTNVNIPLATRLPEGIFSSCVRLSTVTFPSVSLVFSYAFYGCTRLSEISFPELLSLYESAFVQCTSLASFSASKLTQIGSWAFQGCTNLSEISLPAVTSLARGAFTNCGLISVTLPNVTEIGTSTASSLTTFYNCSKLVYLNMSKISRIYTYGLYGLRSLATLIAPSVTLLGSYALQSCSALLSLDLPLLSSVSQQTFTDCTALSRVSFPELQYAARSAFYRCGLRSASFPKLESIYDGFANCYSLSQVWLSQCSRISGVAFSKCYNLISLCLLGSSVCTLVGTSAFTSTPLYNYSTSAGRWGSIFVLSSLVAEYKAANGWKTMSSRIFAYEDYFGMS